MTDIAVSTRMSKCCRKTLEDIDKQKKKAKFKTGLLSVPSLAELFADKPIDVATKLLVDREGKKNARAGLPQDEHEILVRAACEAICIKHAKVHASKEETMDERFWRSMASQLQGESS